MIKRYSTTKAIVAAEIVEERILFIRGEKVMLDRSSSP
jgi:hypothetical protein